MSLILKNAVKQGNPFKSERQSCAKLNGNTFINAKRLDIETIWLSKYHHWEGWFCDLTTHVKSLSGEV